MAEFIIIGTTISFVGFMVTLALAIRAIRKSHKVVVKEIIDDKHVVYKFRSTQYEVNFNEYYISGHKADIGSHNYAPCNVEPKDSPETRKSQKFSKYPLEYA